MSDDIKEAGNLFNSWPEKKRKEFISLVGKSLEESLNPKR